MSSTTKKILIFILGIILLFILFKFTEPAQAQYGFWRLRTVGGLEQASVGEIIIRVIQWIMAIVGLICVAFIIYGGVMYATSGGSEEHITRAKKILLWSIIGLIICILAFTIAAAVVGMIGGEGGVAGGCYGNYEGPVFLEPNAKAECQGHIDKFAGIEGAYCWCGTFGWPVTQKLYCKKQHNNFNECQTWCGQIMSSLGTYSCDCSSCE